MISSILKHQPCTYREILNGLTNRGNAVADVERENDCTAWGRRDVSPFLFLSANVARVQRVNGPSGGRVCRLRERDADSNRVAARRRSEPGEAQALSLDPRKLFTHSY
jgi:hypothetical protein